MLVHRRVTPSIKFAGTHLYTWVERGTVKMKCLLQEYNTMSPTRGPFLEGPEKFSHTERRSKIPNLMITELFYSHILTVNSDLDPEQKFPLYIKFQAYTLLQF